MRSLSEVLRPGWAWSRLQSSIVVRTTLAILVFSMVLGITFAWIVSASVDRDEQQRAQIRLQQLLSTVEFTAQIVCFVKDRNLAGKIAQGLIQNPGVSGVRISSGGVTLAQIGNASSIQGVGVRSSWIARQLYFPSPSDTGELEPVGEISLFLDRAAIHVEASSYSRAAILSMVAQAALVAAGVALAVFFFSTRPIRAVSHELHRVRFDTNALLHIPSSNRFDEIGTLVSDVNQVLITERQLRVAHEADERRMRLILEKAETGIFVLDHRGILESWNPAFVRLLRLTPEELPESGITQLRHLLSSHAARVGDLIERCVSTGQSEDLDLEFAVEGNAHGGWIEISLKPVGVGGTELQGVVNDITERKRRELATQELASHSQQLADQDSVTGLLNRRGLDSGLAASFTRHAPGFTPELAILQIDLDYFKQVNDQYGHAAGDRVLRQVAKILLRNARRGDLIARPGGDEFVIVLIGIANPLKAEEIAKTIIAEIQQPIDIGGRMVNVGASIGIAFPQQGDSPDTAMARADGALYDAKNAGRNRVRLAPMPQRNLPDAVA